jgi:hypothetical protein
MKKICYGFLLIGLITLFSCNRKSGSQGENEAPQITFEENSEENSINFLIDQQLFTAFRWSENMTKPVFWPILSPECYEITRGFPIEPREGERTDHPHQIGMWLTYGNVNGLDFWGNGSKGLGTKNKNGGIIKHLKADKIIGVEGEVSFVSEESWQDSTGMELLREYTEYHFIAKGKMRIFDRITKFTAGENDVHMPDTKEGMFGIRVARQLELPDTESKDTLSNEITGDYTSSEGITGADVWGTRARWMKLDGKIGDENVSVIICDHPENPNYPTYWHARGYGLFAANPLGAKDFTNGAEVFNFSIPARQSATFKYRVIFESGELMTESEINNLADDFAKKY